MGKQTGIILGLILAVVSAEAFDKYADALAKYKKWQQKYGVPKEIRRGERNRETERSGDGNSIFIPHRPGKEGGRQFQLGEISHRNDILEFQTVFKSPSVVRGTRGSTNYYQTGLGGSEYISRHGTPIYKLRKQNPQYGRKKRDTTSIDGPGIQGWTLLDPNTGRPLGQSSYRSDISPVLRLARNPETELQEIEDINTNQSELLGGSEYLRDDGTPLYKRRKISPYSGRRKREAQRILHRVPRNPRRGWVLLDPSTGRPIQQEEEYLQPNIRNARKPTVSSFDRPSGLRTFQNSAGEVLPIYKYYRKNPFGYSG